MERKINFNAGPATLPEEVLQQAAEAVLSFKNTGMSILELPHRGKHFMEIIDECNALVKELCELDNDFDVIWVSGGGRQIFGLIPMNFINHFIYAGYIDSGYWADEAMQYASYYGKVSVIASSKDHKYCQLPKFSNAIPDYLAYLHITHNNTIFGTQFHHIPSLEIPLIADMSSDILSAPINYKQFSLFYAATQKNLGIAGVGVVGIRKDFLDKQVGKLPPFYDFKVYIKENSIVNTANVYGIFVSLLMLRWIKKRGKSIIFEENSLKAEIIYNAIDGNPNILPYVVEKEDRSMMNVCFNIVSTELEEKLLKICDEHNIINIKGHRAVGGYRVSLYNAITIDDVKKLTNILTDLGR